jgi:hypothetical protein
VGDGDEDAKEVELDMVRREIRSATEIKKESAGKNIEKEGRRISSKRKREVERRDTHLRRCCPAIWAISLGAKKRSGMWRVQKTSPRAPGGKGGRIGL